MSLLNELGKREVWNDFRNYRTTRNQLSLRESRQLDVLIEHEGYRKITDTLSFGYPVRKTITKLNSSKKRTVYSYSSEETWVLKLLAWLLYRYDDRISDSCFSFRRNKTARTAFDAIMKIEGLDECYSLKADIHDYFNSIDVDKLMVILKDIISDDPELVSFLEKLLRQDRCYYNEELIEEKRGAMAGVPLASFFANVYLGELDRTFEEKGIPYLRYSDDIIIFCHSSEELNEADRILKENIDKMGLTLNMDKYQVRKPHDGWEFLGFRYHEGKIDLSEATIEKMKGKIRRKARSLYRWRTQKKASYERTAAAMIRSFDRKFYDLQGDNSFTWTRFYFPVITVSDGLHQIDETMLEYLRYLYSGRHYKGNYRVSYEDMKKLGYTSLVAEYYNWKRENAELNRINE